MEKEDAFRLLVKDGTICPTCGRRKDGKPPIPMDVRRKKLWPRVSDMASRMNMTPTKFLDFVEAKLFGEDETDHSLNPK
jgi:hypothetical protein